jgi:hypothetical protein
LQTVTQRKEFDEQAIKAAAKAISLDPAAPGVSVAFMLSVAFMKGAR